MEYFNNNSSGMDDSSLTETSSYSGILQPNFLKIEQRFADVYNVLPMVVAMEALSADWLCTNCHQLLVRAYRTCCGHRFCGRCVDSLVIRSKRDCPLDQEAIYRHPIVRQLEEKKIELRVHCIRVMCPYGCNNECFVIDLLTHKLECSAQSMDNINDHRDNNDEGYVRVLGIFEEKLDAMHYGIQSATKLMVELKGMFANLAKQTAPPVNLKYVSSTVAGNTVTSTVATYTMPQRTRSVEPRPSGQTIASVISVSSGRSNSVAGSTRQPRTEHMSRPPSRMPSGTTTTTSSSSNRPLREVATRTKPSRESSTSTVGNTQPTKQITRGATTIQTTKQKQQQIGTRSLTTVHESPKKITSFVGIARQSSAQDKPPAARQAAAVRSKIASKAPTAVNIDRKHQKPPLLTPSVAVDPKPRRNPQSSEVLKRGANRDDPKKAAHQKSSGGNIIEKDRRSKVTTSTKKGVTVKERITTKSFHQSRKTDVEEPDGTIELLSQVRDIIEEAIELEKVVPASQYNVTAESESDIAALLQRDVTDDVTEQEEEVASDTTDPENDTAVIFQYDVTAAEDATEQENEALPSDTTVDDAASEQVTLVSFKTIAEDADEEEENEMLSESQYDDTTEPENDIAVTFQYDVTVEDVTDPEEVSLPPGGITDNHAELEQVTLVSFKTISENTKEETEVLPVSQYDISTEQESDSPVSSQYDATAEDVSEQEEEVSLPPFDITAYDAHWDQQESHLTCTVLEDSEEEENEVLPVCHSDDTRMSEEELFGHLKTEHLHSNDTLDQSEMDPEVYQTENAEDQSDTVDIDQASGSYSPEDTIMEPQYRVSDVTLDDSEEELKRSDSD